MSDTPTWTEVVPPPVSVSNSVSTALETLEPLKHAWEEAAEADPDGFRETRLRTLRSHAIETGIIERLYDVDWGMTQALVAEGLAMEAVEGRGTLDGDTLAVINDQYDALEYVTEMAQEDKELTVQFIRELHQIITRHQTTYDAVDSLGRSSRPPLNHGTWKQTVNYLVR